ncbi:MAG: hypothetical protein ACYCZR_12400 [Burkholderiales bacterium]
MRTETVTTTRMFYTIDELRDGDDYRPFENALQNIKEHAQPDADWVDEDLQAVVTELFGDDAQVTEWCVGWCQSDGAKFTASFDVPLALPTEEEWKPALPPFPNDKMFDATWVSFTPNRGGGVDVRINFARDDDDTEYAEGYLRVPLNEEDEAHDAAMDWYGSMCHYLYTTARSEYEYWWDDEPCVKYARNNELEFTEDGELA